jgi:hypothetical protein
MQVKFSSVDDAWLLSLDISVQAKQDVTFIEYITIGELSQGTLFNIVYCINSLITFLDDIPIKYESSETTRASGKNKYNSPAHAPWC